jgi:MoxR-like ATPase
MNIHDVRQNLHAEIKKTVLGQESVVDGLFASLLVGGHVLLEGPPGVAKTLIAASLSRAIGCDFKRIQFTPDLLPADLTGTIILKGSDFIFRPGPVFANILLADEINRTPPKTQAALLEAMGEKQVTIDATAHKLPDPFMVVATQNPVEFEGTYPLPEAQLDRFLMKLIVNYPDPESEYNMLLIDKDETLTWNLNDIKQVTTIDQIKQLSSQVNSITVSAEVARFISNLTRFTRDLPSVELGCSPRSAVHLLAASKAFAALSARDYVIPDDVIEVAPTVLAHRLIMTPEAELDNFSPYDAINTALQGIPIPR